MARMRSCYPVASLRCCCAHSRSMSTWLCEQEAQHRGAHTPPHTREATTDSPSQIGPRRTSAAADLPCKGELKPGSEQCWAAQRLVRVFSSCAGLVL